MTYPNRIEVKSKTLNRRYFLWLKKDTVLLCRINRQRGEYGMGHFKDQLIRDYDKDPQKHCKECNKMISDVAAYENNSLCDDCKK